MKVLSVCNYCGKVRDESDHWHWVKSPIGGEPEQLDPAICPDCYIKNFGPEFHAIPLPGPVGSLPNPKV
jgi:hypothetical protein